MKKLTTNKPKITEKLFQQRIIDGARALGYLVYHTFDSRRSAKGFPDLVLCHPKRDKLYFIEVKNEDGKVTAEQEQWIESLKAIETLPLAYIIRPDDWDKWFWEELKR